MLVFDDAGSLTNRYLHGPAVDRVFADEDALAEVLWGLADHQGTVRDVADYDAALDETTVANHRQFDSFGNLTAESAPAVEFAYAYTGREWDADAELYYYRGRWYDPLAGRFLSEDPSGFDAGDANLYRYVTNSPLNFTDPTGRRLFSPVTAIRAAGALAGLPFSGAASLAVQAGAGDLVSSSISAFHDFAGSFRDTARSVVQDAFRDFGSRVASVFRPAPQRLGPTQAAELLASIQAASRSVPLSPQQFQLRMSEVRCAACHGSPQSGFENVAGYPGRAPLMGDRQRAAIAAQANPWSTPITDDIPQVSAAGAVAAAELAGSFIPGVGEALDLAALVNPNTAWWQKGLAGASLLVSVVTLGASPNFGAASRSVSHLDDVGELGSTTLHVAPSPRLVSQYDTIDAGGIGFLDDFAPAVARPSTRLPARVTQGLPAGQGRTPAEVAQARNFFERNRDTARRMWEQRTGERWPASSTHDSHPRPLKDGGDPLFIEPGYGRSTDVHTLPRPEYGGLSDAQRWGQMGGRPKKNP